MRSGMVDQIKREVTILQQVPALGAPACPPACSGRLAVGACGCACWPAVLKQVQEGAPAAAAAAAALPRGARARTRCTLHAAPGRRRPRPPQIRHPHIVNLLEVMSSRDKIYMVLELVTGGELFDHVVANGPIKVRGPPSR